MRDYVSGCSAFSWQTKNGLHLWGRNFDFNRLAGDTEITFVPRGTAFYSTGSAAEGNLKDADMVKARYSFIGTGSLVPVSTPTLYEGMNEKGLMGGQLYYRKFAAYPDEARAGTIALQPAFAVTYFLAVCASVQEIAERLENGVTLVNSTLFGAVPNVHWMFSDKSGESIVIEPSESGVNVYRNSMGVLTNSPSYSWHRENLLNYSGISSRDREDLSINGEVVRQCFSGSGALGLPGDFSSPSRFVRLSFMKKYGVMGNSEESGVVRMFRIFQNVAFPLGMVEIGEGEHITEYDEGVSPYDYTVYTAVMCADSLRFYWDCYDRMEIRCIDFGTIKDDTEIRRFDMNSPSL